MLAGRLLLTAAQRERGGEVSGARHTNRCISGGFISYLTVNNHVQFPLQGKRLISCSRVSDLLMEFSFGCRRVPCCHTHGDVIPGQIHANKRVMKACLTIFTDVPFSPADGCLLLLFLTQNQSEEGQTEPVDTHKHSQRIDTIGIKLWLRA